MAKTSTADLNRLQNQTTKPSSTQVYKAQGKVHPTDNNPHRHDPSYGSSSKPSNSGNGGGGGGGGGSTEREYYTGDRENSGMDAYYDRMESLIREAQEADRAAKQAAYDEAAGSVNNQTDDALRMAAINKRLSQKNFDQIMAASGRSGGGSESALAQIETGYGEDRNSLEKARLSEIAGLRSQLNSGLAATSVDYNGKMIDMLGQRAQNEYEMARDVELAKISAAQKAQAAANKANPNAYKNDPEWLGIAGRVASGEYDAQRIQANAEMLLSTYGDAAYRALLSLAPSTGTGTFY